MAIDRSYFEFGSGLADDFDGRVVAVRFGLSEQYRQKASDAIQVLLTFESPDLDQPYEQGWSIGGDWTTKDQGREAVNAKGKKAFQANCRGGELVQKLLTLVGKGDLEKGREWAVERGIPMTRADFYEGFNCHWKREKRSTVGGAEADVLFPTALLEDTVSPTAKVPDVSDDAVESVIALAEGKTERELKLAVNADEKLKANSALMNQVLNKGLIADLVKSGRLQKGTDGKFI